MALSLEEQQEFLALPHVAALSVAVGPDRGPLTVPIWYDFTVLVHRAFPTARYVSVEGKVVGTQPATPSEIRLMASRYLPADAVEGYLEFARREHVIRMRPEHWLSADLDVG